MINNNRKYGYWWVIGIGVIIILAFYGKYIFNANEYLYGNYADSLKNYHTFAWHINYDSSYTHFSGMNYPFGEHIVFTDNQPLVSNTLRFINRNVLDISNGVIGINNILLFVGLLICIVYLYKIFFALTHNVRVSVAAGVVLGMLSPQIERFNGHFALAYCFVIPLFIWWMYTFFNTPNWRTSRAMAIILLLLLFVHLYYLIIIGALLLAMWLMFLIRESPRINIFTAIPHIFIQVVAPLAVYFIWLKLTDTITDRPTKPYGIIEYAAHWEGLLLPLGFEYFKPLKAFFSIRKVSLETISYAGLPSLLFILWAIVTGVRRLFKKKTQKEATHYRLDKPYNQRFMVCLIWAVGIVFVFAAFFPLLLSIPSVSKYLGLLKQFRSMGRLLWVVYYGLTIFIVWYIYQKTKNKIQLGWVVWAVLAVFAIEGGIYNWQQTKLIGANYYKKLSWIPQEIQPKNYQAIIPLPFFHEGSESVGATPANDRIVEQSFLLSLQTGIPLQAVKMSRTSLSQTLQQLEMGFEYTAIPQVLYKGNKKPYLLLHYINDSTTLPELKKMHPIAQTDSFKLYSFSPKLLEVLLIKRAAKIETQAQMQSNSLYFFNNYDSFPAMHVFSGKGAMVLQANTTTTLSDTSCVFCADSLTISFWMYAKMEGIPQLKLLITNNDDAPTRVHIPHHIKAVNKDWILVEYNYPSTSKKIKIQLLKEDAAPKQLIYLDNFLVRATQHDALQIDSEFVAKNNRVIFRNNP